MEPVANQCHTYGMSFWIPYQGTGTSRTSEYEIRSVLCSSFNSCWDMRRKDLDYGLFRRLMAERKEIAPLFLGDFYPLTGYSLKDDVWIAWQYDKPEEGRGVVQVFRRAQSPYEAVRVRLHGLDPAAKYRLKELGRSRRATIVSGAELTERGLRVAIEEQPGSAFITYTRVQTP
jgi:alpha-galactosidase